MTQHLTKQLAHISTYAFAVFHGHVSIQLLRGPIAFIFPLAPCQKHLQNTFHKKHYSLHIFCTIYFTEFPSGSKHARKEEVTTQTEMHEQL